MIYFDGRRVDPNSIEKMTAAMDYRGPDGVTHWSQGSVAFGHCKLATTQESLDEVQPLSNEDGSLTLVMDGWLSNWQELRLELLGRGAILRTRSDAELVLRAYEIWGDGCLQHIDGEFAFLIWDGNRQEAFFTADHIGLKMLHYHWDGKRLVVASDIAGVLAAPGMKLAPNQGRISEYLTFEWASRGETIWQGIMRAVPACWTRIGRGKFQHSKYWEPAPDARIVYKTDAEYFDHYRSLFADCVRRSSRSHLPLACDVSGGLDSSAVFSMAHHLRRASALHAPHVKGYTYHFENASGTAHDEIEYARAVAKHVGEHVEEVSPFMPDLRWFLERGKEDFDIAGYPNGAMSIAIGKKLVADGCRVILNGEGGDEWLAGTPHYYAEQLAAHNWRALGRSVQEDFADIGPQKTAGNLLRYGLAPMLPNILLAGRRKLVERLRSSETNGNSLLSPAFLKSLGGNLRARPNSEYMRIANKAQRSKYMVMTDPFALVTWDQVSRQSARLGYEVRTPLYARKFIEFAFATPERLRLRGSTRKFMHIRALDSLLPALVANRKTKANFDVAFTRLLGELKSDLAATLLRGGSGRLDRAGVSKLFDRQSAAPQNFRLVWHLWTLFEMEDILKNAPFDERGK